MVGDLSLSPLLLPIVLDAAVTRFHLIEDLHVVQRSVLGYVGTKKIIRGTLCLVKKEKLVI